jgi:hypothetical protein
MTPDYLMNIYAQEAWHGDAYIVGTREALEKLHLAVEQALLKGLHCEDFMVGSDGEGYSLKIVAVDTDDEVGLMMTPYIDDVAADSRDDCHKPWDIYDQKLKEMGG